MLSLQRHAGNQAVTCWLAGLGASRNASATGRSHSDGQRRAAVTIQRSAIVLDGGTVPGTAEEDTLLFRMTAVIDRSYKGPSTDLEQIIASWTRLLQAFRTIERPSQWDREQIEWIAQQVEVLTVRGIPQVISGHGTLDEAKLPRGGEMSQRGRSRGPVQKKFPVPNGITLILYAPDGAALDNEVANAIESGRTPERDELEVKHIDSAKTIKFPDGTYRYEIRGPAEATNYTVGPPDRLAVMGTPVTVTQKTLLSDLLTAAQMQGYTHVHYACCSTQRLAQAGPYSGYYVQFKRPK